MHFTREPIIETIITPREGSKLLLRSSRSAGQEEFLVDAIEVVSFGHSFFFRSSERPKCFLVPVSDYEVVEVKETRVALKNVSVERTIKIGGGREAAKPAREEKSELQETEAASTDASGGEQQRPSERRRDRRRHHRRRRGDEMRREDTAAEPASGAGEGGGAPDETPVSSPVLTKLFPPPPTLISETISRYKDYAISEEPSSEMPVEKEKKKKKEEEAGGDVQELSRSTLSFSIFNSFLN